MTSLDEQETTVTWCRANDVIYIYTSNVVHLRALRKRTDIEEVMGGDDWGDFRVSTEVYDPLKGFKRKRTLTDEQRAAAGERLRKAREAKNG